MSTNDLDTIQNSNDCVANLSISDLNPGYVYTLCARFKVYPGEIDPGFSIKSPHSSVNAPIDVYGTNISLSEGTFFRITTGEYTIDTRDYLETNTPEEPKQIEGNRFTNFLNNINPLKKTSALSVRQDSLQTTTKKVQTYQLKASIETNPSAGFTTVHASPHMVPSYIEFGQAFVVLEEW